MGGHHDSFRFGGYTFTNISNAGPTMTIDIIRDNVIPTIQAYKYRYWIEDVAIPGNRIWHLVTAVEGETTEIDFSTFLKGTTRTDTSPSAWTRSTTRGKSDPQTSIRPGRPRPATSRSSRYRGSRATGRLQVTP